MGKIKHGRYKASEDLLDQPRYTGYAVVDIYAKTWVFSDRYHGKRCPVCRAWYEEEEGESCDCEQGYSFDHKKRK